MFSFAESIVEYAALACLDRDTLWLTQASKAEGFGWDRSVINKRLWSVLAEGDLDQETNVQDLHIAWRRRN